MWPYARNSFSLHPNPRRGESAMKKSLCALLVCVLVVLVFLAAGHYYLGARRSVKEGQEWRQRAYQAIQEGRDVPAKR